MKLSILLECIALMAAANAATFKMPIISLGHERSPLSKARVAAMIEAGESRARKELTIEEQNTRRHRNSQTAGSGPIGVVENDGKFMDFIKASSTLQPPPIEPEKSKRALPLWHWEELTYTTPIRIGTPPQPLNLLLSLSSASLFIPSSTCTTCLGTNSYIATNSNTHIRHNAAFTSSSHLFHSRGNLCHDAIHLPSYPTTTTIETQIFGEMEEMERYLPWSEESWDGALGLALGSGSEMGVVNNLMNQGLLDRNVFSLRLPRGRGEKGEILFGGVDHDLYVGELKSLQLVEEEKGRWAVAATRLSVNDGEGLVLEMNGGTAVLETDFPFIGLPEKYVRILDKKLGMKNAGKEWDWVRSVDCSRRKLMQNITIGLGGEEFVVSPWEYTVEADMGDLGGGRRCVSAFVPNEDEGMDVVLGSVLLRAFYGVFDLDRRTVSLARATSQKIQKSKVDWEEDELR